MKVDVMSLKFDDVTLEQAVEIALTHVAQGEKCVVVTPNAEIAYLAKKNVQLKEIINTAQLVLPDGVGVVLASKMIGNPLKSKVAGVEFGEQLLKTTTEPVFLLGGQPGVAKKAAQNMMEKYPSCNIVGTGDGYFKDPAQVIKTVNASGAKILFVCLGAPRQEFFMQQYRDQFSPNVMAGLGGSLDVFAGTVKRAPKFFVKLGLEWIYRLLKQPSRIKRMAALPLYAIDSVLYRLKGGTHG